MKRLVKKKEALGMDLTPLIDVVFLLLIFFIATSEFKKNESILKLTLPNSASKAKLLDKKEIFVEMSSDKLAYNTKEISFEDLRIILSKIKKDSSITIKIDQEVKYSKITQFLDILNTLGLTNLLLVTKQK